MLNIFHLKIRNQKQLIENREEYINLIPTDDVKLKDRYINLDIKTVQDAIKTLRNNKASGIGAIHAELIKYGIEKLSVIIIFI